ILHIQREIVKTVFRHQLVPRPGVWTNLKEIQSQMVLLREILSTRVKTSSLWGFKDPQTTMTIPLWISLFNNEKIIPQYVFCTRQPASIIESMSRQYGADRRRCELVWFLRTIWFLKHIGCRSFILHYEDWFTRPSEILSELMTFLNLERQ